MRFNLATLPSSVRVVEVGPRDGLQNEKVLVPTEQKIRFINMLAEAGLPVVEATSFVSPRAIPQLGDAGAVMVALTQLPTTQYHVLVPNLKGMERALAAGVRLHGATVHFVSDRLDGGPIVAQAAVPVWPDDSEDVLAARVLEQEHLLLPRCVRWILEGRVRLQGDRVVAEGIAPQDLLVFAR